MIELLGGDEPLTFEFLIRILNDQRSAVTSNISKTTFTLRNAYGYMQSFYVHELKIAAGFYRKLKN